MAKPKNKLKVRFPSYETPRNKWRKLIYKELGRAAREQKIKYDQDIHLELSILLYLAEDEIDKHDVDNRLKDIMDALQGRAGGPKDRHDLDPIVHNDNQIFKVIIEKRIPPKQSKGWMHLEIKKYK